MSITNHILAGSIIAVVIKNPVVALPLALVSHFVLDSLPHFGFRQGGIGAALKHRITYLYEILNLVLLVYVLIVLRHEGFIPYLAGFIAVSPDLIWVYRYLGFEIKGEKPPAAGWVTRFHKKIQWCERPWGVVVELIFVTVFLIILEKNI